MAGIALVALPIWLPTLGLAGVSRVAHDLYFDQVRHVLPARKLPFPPLLEWTSAAPLPFRLPAALTAWQAYSQQLASIMGAGIGVILAATLSRDQLYAWGWRIPFMLGVLIAPVALYIRRQLPETIDEGQAHRSTGAVLSELMRHHSRAVVFGVLIICGGTVSTYVFNYMTTFAITTLHLSATIATALGVAGSVAQIAGLAVGVWLDRLGRKRMLILSRVIFVLVVYPGYLMLTADSASTATIRWSVAPSRSSIA